MTKRRRSEQEATVPTPPSMAVEEASIEAITPLQMQYLRLLEHSIEMKNSYQSDPAQEEWLMKAINRTAYSAFQSCVENGVGGQARIVLGMERQAN